ncbi:MAG: carbon-nitrogen hydrolase family protein [Novosphingobium sp.]|uniref:carbon-nitrogen hydrolase family protein n=1 Tax=Novosphingobium sp. TaxID=1874826 RepID=UPI003C7D75F5
MKRIALLQMTSGVDPAVNGDAMVSAVFAAEMGGASMLFTPEMSALLDRNRERGGAHVLPEEQNPVLDAVRSAAAKAGIWVAIGSMAVLRDDGRWANRAFVIDGSGAVVARYDKIHMFDVDLATGESWRESNAYAPGSGPVVVETPLGRLGLTVCYDLRFPALFEAYGRAGVDLIAIPAAFTVPTGQAHWHVLQRARAIEATAYVIAAAQVGKHADGRETFGHSLVIDPWGEVLLDMGGEAAGMAFAELDPARIAAVRAQVPCLANKRAIAT